jgi:hypothetical protein
MDTQPAAEPGRYAIDEDGEMFIVSLHGDMTIEQWRDFLTMVSERMDRQPKFVFVVDALGLTSFASEARKAVVDWRKQNHQKYPQAFYGISYVIKSAMIRGALQAGFWIMRPPVPYVISATREGALQWAASVMRRGKPS